MDIPETEWKTDEQGKRYREVGNHMREYEMMIHTEAGYIPQSQLADFQKRSREAAEQRRRAELEAKRNEPTAQCPFRSGMNTTCKSDCTFFADPGCRLAAHNAIQDTQGKQCVFTGRKCDSTCAMYKNGCALPPLPTINKTERT